MAERKKSERKSVLLRLEPELFERVEAARGDVSRQRWLERLVEAGVAGSSEARVRASAEARKGEPTRPEMLTSRETKVPSMPPPAEDFERFQTKSIVPPVVDGGCPYSAAQLAGMAKVPVAAAKRAIEDGSWMRLL